MIKNLLLICAAAASLSLQAASLKNTTDFKAKSLDRLEKAHKGPRYAEEKLVWLPGTITKYYWNDWEKNDWELNREVKLTYTENGLVATEEGNSYLVSYEYNENGQVISRINTSNGDFESKTEYAYDAVSGACISEKDYEYNKGQWILQYGEEMVITRDEKGNIVKTEYYSLEGEEKVLSNYTVIKYGDDGMATEIINYEVDDDEVEIEFDLTDIIWQNSNGQILIDDTNDMDIDDYFWGANRVKSATINNFDGEGVTVYVSAEYPDNDGSVIVNMTLNDKVFYTASLTVIDSFGSVKDSSTETEFEVENGVVTFGDVWSDSTTEIYDAYGNLIEYESSSESPWGSWTSKEIGEVTYDETYGYPLEVIYKYSSNDGEFTNSQRTVYSDYARYSGVESVVADENAPVEFYNLQGVRVENPANGLYIRRQGNSVSKVLVK